MSKKILCMHMKIWEVRRVPDSAPALSEFHALFVACIMVVISHLSMETVD